MLSTYAVFFFGTPHFGGTGAKLGAYVAKVLQVTGASVDGATLKGLDAASPDLAEINSMFKQIRNDFKVTYAYKRRDTPMIGRVRT